MPRGRHRHSPPLHRLLPPSAIAGVSLVCALGPWAFSEQLVLRALAAAAAVTAVLGAVVMRRWDIQAGKQVADLTRARASDEWRFEERVAELESDLDESRELRVKLEQRLRAKRAELAALRNEHAALLRRYATAETERATALEGRRLLEIEATAPARALPPARAAEEAPGAGTGAVATRKAAMAEAAEAETLESVERFGAQNVGSAQSVGSAEGAANEANAAGATEDVETAEDAPRASEVFSPAGSQLFLRAQAALARFDGDAAGSAKPAKGDVPTGAEPARTAPAETGADAEAAREDEAEGKPEAVDEHTRAAAPDTAAGENGTPVEQAAPEEATARPEYAEATDAALEPDTTLGPDTTLEPEAARPAADGPPVAPDPASRVAASELAAREITAAESADPETADPEAVAPDAADREAAPSDAGTRVPRSADPVRGSSGPPSGHFTVPTAVAVVPTAQPVRRPVAEGGFDFFGTQKSSASEALEAVQNEDLADVVGQEALALHKAESEAEFKPADEEARGVGQVIDLTAHDETEQIDVEGLRSAVS
ncbi:hypothetical protein ACIBBD_35670 [Streptomyces sp. NPDC051315]|uniref:hypothetical protein n=1 Tax=Streptomyces sp. NPDC051315 TaxID=3365650 RepID=UPI0037912CB1